MDTNEVLTVGALEVELTKFHESITDTVKKAQEEATNAGSVATETKSQLESLCEQATAVAERLHELEQKGETLFHRQEMPQTIGEMVVKHEQYELLRQGARGARIELKTAIINQPGGTQPQALVDADRRPGFVHNANRRLTIRDLLPTGQTNSNAIEFAKENVFTNSAGPQVGGSPEAFENVTKPESGITFTLANEPVQTLAHWIPASKQVLDDSPALQSYINARLMYGLKLEEEDQLLNGSGANGNLNGLITQATAWTPTSPITDAPVNVQNRLDQIRDAMRQANASEYIPDGIVVNYADWADMETLKVNPGTDDRYIIGDPRSALPPTLWGTQVVPTNSIAAGTFLVGSFMMGAQVWDRMNAIIEISRENSDNFVKNMCTILAEERVCLTVYRPAAFITGSFL